MSFYKRQKKQLSGKNLYIQDAYSWQATFGYVETNIRVVTEIAWQAHFL